MFSQPALRFAAMQQSAGNLAIQRLIGSDLLRPDFTIAQPEAEWRPGTTFPQGNITTGAQTWNQSSVVPKQSAEAANPLAPPAEKGNEPPPALDESGLKKTPAGEAPVEKEIPQEAAAPEQAPASPEQDPQYQIVVEEMEIKAKHQKTPAKKPEQKQDETVLAAKAITKDLTNTRYAKENHLGKLGLVQPDDLTVPQFMAEFGVAVQKLEANVPTNNSDEQRAVFESAQKTATQDVAAQGKNHSQPFRDEANKDPSNYPDNKKEEATDYKLERDPAGNVPAIKQARAAAPKPESEKVISLDDKSRELDEALQNHDVAGQKINIDESSLALPVSGEKSFDEAGEAKRQAQAEIARSKPRYREQETEVIGKSQNDIDSLVNVRGLQGHHGLRSEGFKKVLGHQEQHKTGIISVKQEFSNRVEGIYKDTKDKVDEALNSLTEGYTIEEELEWILTDADNWFKGWTRTALKYIYPGFFETSDFTDDYKDRILAEYKQLLGEKYHDLDEALERLSTKHKTLSDIGKSLRSIGGADVGLYFQALSNVQHQVSLEYFEQAKAHFIYLVTADVEKKIARRVVNAVNRARRAIVKGKEDVDAAYAELSPKDQKEVDDVYQAVKGRFEELRKSVDERQHEIVADIARTYNKSVGKLKATFEAIKKDVRMGFFERAWNKIKAVVNAIIDFATRLAELLGKMIGLLGDIISSPRVFFRNLAAGISEGFSEFGRRIDEFLATAFFDWIRGKSGVVVQFPKEWNAAGIFSLFTQLLNLSTETVWQRMEVVYDKTVANAFRRGEALLEKGLEIFEIVKREGLGGLWNYIVESLGSILSDTLDEMKETVLYAAIKKVMIEIGKMLVPGGGFIAIAEKVIRLVMFIVEARNKILDLIEAFVLSMENAVKGDIAGIVKRVTSALTKFITIALDFLVAFFGLSDLKEKVERFIERMRSPIIRGIDFVLQKFKPLVIKGKELFEKGKEKVIEAGKAVVQVGVPQDPNERLRLAARASVSAAKRLTGRVTRALLNPILGGIRIRYGFTAIEPYERGGSWWVKATINPDIDQDLGVPSEKADQAAADVREVANRALEKELRDTSSREEAQRIVGQVAQRLRPQGLKGLEIGSESSEEGWTIYAEASAKRPLGKLIREALKTSQEVPRRVSVRTAVQLKLAKAVAVPGGFFEATHPGVRPKGGIWLPSSTSTKLRIVGWNITALTSANASDHAEDQVVNELRKRKDVLENVETITLQNFNLSPCDDCCGELRKLLNEIVSCQKGNPKLKTADIYWQEPYERAKEIPGHHSATQTTWEGIRKLTGGRGWTIHAPPHALPLKETGEIPKDIYARYVYKRYDTAATIKPAMEVTAP